MAAEMDARARVATGPKKTYHGRRSQAARLLVATLNPSAGAMDAVGLRVAGLERLPSCRPVDCKRAGEATVRNTSVRAYSALPLARTTTPHPQPISLTTA